MSVRRIETESGVREVESYRYQKTKKMHPSNPLYQYHLEGLEDDCRAAYQEWTTKKESKDARYNLFITLENICFAVAQLTDIPTNHVNRADIAYEMSLWMFERILSGEFIPVGTAENKRFPWQVYIRRCIPGFIPYPNKENGGRVKDFIRVSWENFTERIEEEEEDPLTKIPGSSEDIPELIVTKKYMRKKIVEALRLYYTEKEIRRLFHMFCALCEATDRYPARDPNTPSDLREFAITVLAVAKRIAKSTNINYTPPTSPENLTQAIQSAIRSTMFLAAVTERSSHFPRELVMSLDMDSLFRLCQCAGGKTIRIPTDRELNSVIQASSTAAEMLTTGYQREETTTFSQQPGELPGAAGISLTPLITKIIQHHSIFGDTQSERSNTMHDILLQSVQGLDKLIDRIISTGVQNNQVLYAYSELSYTVMNILKILGQHARMRNDSEDQPPELPGSRELDS